MEHKLTVGILVNRDRPPLWLSEAIERAGRLEGIDLVRIDCEGFPARDTSGLLYRVFELIDRRLSLSRRIPDSFQRSETGYQLGDAVCRIAPESVASGIAILQELDLLTIVDCTNMQLPQELATAAVGGMWRHVLSNSGRADTVPNGFYEVLHSQPVTTSVLEMVGADGERSTLEQTWTTTYALSPSVNINYVQWSAALLLERALKRISETSWQAYQVRDRRTEEIADPASPDLIRQISLILKYGLRIVSTWLHERVFWDQWHLKFRLSDEHSWDLGEYETILPPLDEFWADPHVLERNGKYYAFVEVYTKKRRLGHQGVIEIDPNGHWTPPREVLVKDYHVSYPFLVEEGGKLYMIPETKKNNAIELYECVEFPHRWEFCMTLMEGVKAVDTTLIFEGGSWWMFVVLSLGNERTYENLLVFSSPTLLTKNWVPHPLNPVVSDARRARPAGALYKEHGKWYRPAQDCSYKYGYGLRIFEIVELTRSGYVEREVRRIEPDWSKRATGIHTLARSGRLSVVDCRQARRRF